MKFLFATTFLCLSLLAASAVSAHAQGLPTTTVAATHPTVRPLTRYLAAMLRLTPKQAADVQEALRTRPVRTLAPEDLTVSLSPVLNLDAQQRLQSLQTDVTTYRALYYLATRH